MSKLGKLKTKNKEYTVRVYESGRVLLEELVNPDTPFEVAGVIIWDEPGFNSKRFASVRTLEDQVAEIEKSFVPEKEVLTEKLLAERLLKLTIG